MTAAAMASVFMQSKNKSIKQYEKLLFDGLNQLRNNNENCIE